MWQERHPRKPYPSDVTDQQWAILARLYPFMRHSRGSQSSGSAVRWEFPLCQLSQVTWENG
jgi:hypothetical protein